MVFDGDLAQRVRDQLAGTQGIVEKKMLGGIAFLANGNVSVGIHGSELIVRIDPAETEAALKRRGVRLFDSPGNAMKGWLRVSGEALVDREALAGWVKKGVAFAQSLPRK